MERADWQQGYSGGTRRAAEMRGRLAEDRVAESWEARGYNILARRLRTGAGEIDLVVADADQLVFVEVKARRSRVEAANAILPRQQRRLLLAAEAAIAANQAWHRSEIRFDVALVCREGIVHIEDAIRHN